MLLQLGGGYPVLTWDWTGTGTAVLTWVGLDRGTLGRKPPHPDLVWGYPPVLTWSGIPTCPDLGWTTPPCPDLGWGYALVLTWDGGIPLSWPGMRGTPCWEGWDTHPPEMLTDRHLWKQYLPSSFGWVLLTYCITYHFQTSKNMFLARQIIYWPSNNCHSFPWCTGCTWRAVVHTDFQNRHCLWWFF